MTTTKTGTSLSIDGQGRVREAYQIPSPNCDARPTGEEISLVVIHGISLPEGEFGTPYIDHLFTNQIVGDEAPGFAQLKALRVSAHLLIRRQGQLVQYVSLQQRAWHAGVSTFQGRERCNDFSIGVELEGADTIPYTELQYQQLEWVLKLLLLHYPQITPARIVGHCDIAPGRKSDPGVAFEWERVTQQKLSGAAGSSRP
ncbi:MAG: 1,6-anhydro-N-acetylmuramyl-L-alanine amidase AmpD [Gammaproteobacteria bacterium]|nr:1,6-anhydro-N-acetylmuramyl-L-alanine amidase AmpD [Gammaproteobacteria bacterium]MBT3488204.1 1,6-anhydro-N-acetylmuramyl-L-alanine amidase AmpD [Gammaproteobacteria bacterium]MBT3719029.1 1,6-anhydro-N-acetylmuramyl-L-alanine amidase AmpD [Gammaproteobacteria bacterium]MBT3843883.1 1,6-anhydro-N-acetylmuramyl-L-alanine amidase AmpD [Gammaproteobacteria bacterium]MBT3892445.1 1,6-anhydro-N-acetylmuramyl-L-alanine amidase AmpD [Gammaproteobacteria bacterium]